MFDLSWTELLVVAGVAILIVGPKDLPRALRAVGNWAGKAKRMSRDFRRQFDEAIREAELDTIKNEVESVGKIDPVADLRKEVREIETDLKTDVDQKTPPKPADDRGVAAELAVDTGTDEPASRPPAAPASATPAADVKP